MPALAELREAGRLPVSFSITGTALQELDTEVSRRLLDERLERLSPAMGCGLRASLLSLLEYRRADVTRREEVAQALGKMTGPVIVYLALPPGLFAPPIESLAAAGLPAGSRIVVEKPFGEDLPSARDLNLLLHRTALCPRLRGVGAGTRSPGPFSLCAPAAPGDGRKTGAVHSR